MAASTLGQWLGVDMASGATTSPQAFYYTVTCSGGSVGLTATNLQEAIEMQREASAGLRLSKWAVDDDGEHHEIESETRLVKHSEAWWVAREMAIEGTLWCLQQYAEQCDWLACLLLLWDLVRLSMLAGRCISSSQGVDGKALFGLLLEGLAA